MVIYRSPAKAHPGAFPAGGRLPTNLLAGKGGLAFVSEDRLELGRQSGCHKLPFPNRPRDTNGVVLDQQGADRGGVAQTSEVHGKEFLELTERHRIQEIRWRVASLGGSFR